MNMIAPGMNALATVETLTALDVFTDEKHEELVARLEVYVRALPKDMDTPKGRDEIRSLAAKVARTKTGLDDLGKEFVADLKKQTGAVDAKRKLIRDRLDALRDEVRGPLTAFEEAEAKRINDHEAALIAIMQGPADAAGGTSVLIRTILSAIEKISARDWQEFEHRGIGAFQESRDRLAIMLAAAVQQEADAAELIALRKQAAEQQARDVAARLEAEKAENARIAAEAEAARIAEAVERAKVAAEKAAAAELERAAQAVRDAEAAAAKAVEAERLRVAREEGDRIAAAAKLERNKKHRAKVHNEIAGFLMGDAGLSNDHAHSVVEQLAAGSIPHVTITY